jgi:hypothetical protein
MVPLFLGQQVMRLMLQMKWRGQAIEGWSLPILLIGTLWDRALSSSQTRVWSVFPPWIRLSGSRYCLQGADWAVFLKTGSMRTGNLSQRWHFGLCSLSPIQRHLWGRCQQRLVCSPHLAFYSLDSAPWCQTVSTGRKRCLRAHLSLVPTKASVCQWGPWLSTQLISPCCSAFLH